MKILVLAHALRAGGGKEVGVNLLGNLRDIDRDNHYCFVVPDQQEYRELHLDGHRHRVVYYRRRLGHLGRWLFDSFSLRRVIDDYGPDAVCGLGNRGVERCPCPQAVLIHNPHLVYDTAGTLKLNLSDALAVESNRRALRKTLPHTQLLFCQTETMVGRVRRRFGYRGRSLIVPNAISSVASGGDRSTPAPLLPYAGRFKLFYLTRYYPHKGLEMLVEVMDRYREQLSDAVAFITIDAGQHPGAARLLETIRTRTIQNVVNVGPLKQQELAGYYAAADALVMPTLLESFSGTYLEAMQFGLPILTSDIDFAREVCGEAALYFDPGDAESIRDVITRVRDDAVLRSLLGENGRQRLAREFGHGWQDIAATVKTGIEEMVRGAGAERVQDSLSD